ncbi:hypothetical protein IU500_24660 [Nocardia terpenica]|uniref:hypothetical protein n=1 Tax=Nocardia terpenica TaxID=455432 RepID=UPI0018945EDE|nr:hypothetical protein [Nocardia terpenica]MBF6064693.1 hypothetical protein [Nocardia terpenica]MBF6107209.1 hypothetical protein [Nocardia terpenica]MBF6114967.1 hypothetical protein [Nocardia terpenica]MBF6122072.1 hypothetical protein [Nocardia terpenica]MBF6154455.1 hypothetical protein [Nocardia terpenica]
MTVHTGPSFERIQDAFITVSGQPTSNGAWTTFLCPAHDDNQASAAIKYDPHQHKTVVRCFAGCPDEAVLGSLGLTVGDLFDQPVSGTQHHKPTLRDRRPQTPTLSPPAQRKRRSLGKQLGWPVEVAQYVYRDIHGMRIGRVIRTRTEHEYGTKKGFYLRRFEPSTGTWPLGAFEPVLYRLPEVAAAIGAGRTVWVCEGEKDADRAVGLGLAATCNALGAGSFTPAHAQHLTGARRVVIVADRDRAGYAHARTVRKLAVPLVQQVVVVQARDGNDLSDHLDAGHNLEDLEPATELGYADIDFDDLIEPQPEPAFVEPPQSATIDARLQRLLACVTPALRGPSTPMSAALDRSAWFVEGSTGQITCPDTGAEP